MLKKYKFIGLFDIVILCLFPSCVTSYQDTLVLFALLYLFIIKIVHRVQVKRKQIQTQKRHRNTDTHKKKNQK